MKIFLNSKIYETDSHTLKALKAELKDDSEIVILNGFACSDDEQFKENDEIFLIKKGKKLTEETLENLRKSRNSPFINERLQNAKVAICGLGGLGSNVAIALARLGIGELFLIDFDIVEPSNLNRQNYSIKHLYMPKTQALKDQIHEINPFAKVRILNEKITSENIVEILKNESIICECFDNAVAKAMLINAVAENFSDKFLICASGMAGFGSSNEIKTMKFGSRVYICGDLKSAAAKGMGLMSPRVMICAGHQVNMVLRIILNEFGV